MSGGWGWVWEGQDETSVMKDLDSDRPRESQRKISSCKPPALVACGQEKGHFRITPASGDGIKRDTDSRQFGKSILLTS